MFSAFFYVLIPILIRLVIILNSLAGVELILLVARYYLGLGCAVLLEGFQTFGLTGLVDIVGLAGLTIATFIAILFHCGC